MILLKHKLDDILLLLKPLWEMTSHLLWYEIQMPSLHDLHLTTPPLGPCLPFCQLTLCQLHGLLFLKHANPSNITAFVFGLSFAKEVLVAHLLYWSLD